MPGDPSAFGFAPVLWPTANGASQGKEVLFLSPEECRISRRHLLLSRQIRIMVRDEVPASYSPTLKDPVFCLFSFT
jgi:hypothetical protein